MMTTPSPELREALENIITIDQIERRSCIATDPAGNTYAVEMIDGECAKIARKALAYFSAPAEREPVAWGKPTVTALRGQSRVTYWVSHEDGDRILGTLSHPAPAEPSPAIVERLQDYAHAVMVSYPNDVCSEAAREIDSLRAQLKQARKQEERLRSAALSLQYYVNNPSAWDYYDEAMSERIRPVVEAALTTNSEAAS